MRNILWYALYFLSIITVGQATYSLCTIEVITNPQQGDGFGSQFQAMIASVIYAELHNKKFVYTPFQTMAHNYTNDPHFLAKKEEFINFINNFATINTLDTNNYHVNSEIAFKAFFDSNVVACAQSHALKKIKEIFRANKHTNNYFNNKNLNIVIHIRRPNLHDNRIAGTNTPDTVFLTIINRLRTRYAAYNPLIHIHSQGVPENFKIFDNADVVLHLNESLEDTFLSMVLADVLVTSASSFSYTAGLLSEGIVYYMPFWHASLPHWASANVLLTK